MPLPMLPVLATAGLLAGLVAVVPSLTQPPPPAPATPTTATRAAAAPVAPVKPGLGTSQAVLSAGARPAAGSATVTAVRWRWPVLTTPRVVQRFAPPPKRWQPGHRGVDLLAVPGDTIVAAGAGVVTFAGPLAGRGVVTVTHGALRTTYEPVTATVHRGGSVSTGEPIGTLASGASHCGGYPSCLHWGLLRGTEYLDPLSLLGLGHPVLLPIPKRPA